MVDEITRIVVDRAGMRQLVHEGWVRDRLMEFGDEVASVARDRAPKRTGLGAASIHAEAVDEASGWSAHVSWSKNRFYMRFQNDGTIYIKAQHFMQFGLETIAGLGGEFSTSRASSKPRKSRSKRSLTTRTGEFNSKYYGGTTRKRRVPKGTTT